MLVQVSDLGHKTTVIAEEASFVACRHPRNHADLVDTGTGGIMRAPSGPSGG